MEKHLKPYYYYFYTIKTIFSTPLKKNPLYLRFFSIFIFFLYVKKLYGTWTSTEEYVLWTMLNVNNEEKKQINKHVKFVYISPY